MPRVDRARLARVARTASAARLWFAALLMVFAIAMHCVAQKPAPHTGSSPSAKPIFDGKWWAASFSEERSGYLNGYIDCHVYDAKAKSNSGGWTLADFTQAVDEYYRAHRPTALVSTALKQIDRTAKPHPVLEGGERWTEPHGYYDGMWWRGGSPEEQLTAMSKGTSRVIRARFHPTGRCFRGLRPNIVLS